MKLDKLTFHRRWAEILSGLSDAERLEVYDAIVKYGLDFEASPVSTPTAQMAFKMICSDIDTERRHKNAVAKARSKAGKLGGRPKQPPSKPPEESAPDTSPTTIEVIEDVEIIEEIPAKPSPGGSTATNLFGDEITPEPQRPQKPSKRHYAPDVLMTETEYNTLVSKYGQEVADWCITKLDDYKAARGMTYKSDFRAILNWVIKEYYKQHGRTSTNWQSNQPTAKEQRDIEFASYIADKLGGSGTPK